MGTRVVRVFLRSASRDRHAVNSKNRVRRRWGSHALHWPHRVWTLDTLHCAIVFHLLRIGAIIWPGGHTELLVHDSWRGHAGGRLLDSGFRYWRVVTLDGQQVVSTTRKRAQKGYGYSRKDAYEARLRAGVCTHDEVRQLLELIVANPALRTPVEEYLKTTTKALIVDEVFDGNRLDMMIVTLAAYADVPCTVIGDPWQALYQFRGAEPDLVQKIISRMGFKRLEVMGSHRFKTTEMQDLARELRTGAGVAVRPGSARDVNVVLSSQWSPLWAAGDHVLPLAFGQLSNRTDAALAILLEWFLLSHFGQIPTRGAEAALFLGMDPAILRGDLTVLAPVIDGLAEGTAEDARAALDLLRQIVGTMCDGSIRRLKDTEEAIRVQRLQHLTRRLRATHLIPGMTIHHAKGREWDHVGVRLSESQERQLTRGLSQERESDRALYVALTRARRSVRLV